MSYAPIYNKLQELDTRLSTLENAPKPEVSVVTPVNVAAPVVTPVVTPVAAPVVTPDTSADVFDELNKLKTNYTDLLNECNPLSNKIAILSSTVATLATKAELPDVSGFATKADLPDVSGFATKAEIPDVSGFATKAELPDVSGFATKAELPDVSDLYAKFEYMLNVISQLNIKLTEANDKISALETSRI
jgi:hypothetical protein